MKNIKLISASAGSGKTYRLTKELTELIQSGQVAPNKIIATTFTKKAAEELKSRIRESLIAEGKTREANLLNEAMIGTINSVCLSLLKKFAFYAGESPQLQTLEEEQAETLLREVVGQHVGDKDFVALAEKLFQNKPPYLGAPSNRILYMDDIAEIITKSRANQIEANALSNMGIASAEQFINVYQGPTQEQIRQQAFDKLIEVIQTVNPNNLGSDPLSKYNKLLEIQGNFEAHKETYDDWRTLAKHGIARTHIGNLCDELTDIAGNLFNNEAFRPDYKTYVEDCFQIAERSMKEFKDVKQALGLVDFTDQEALMYDLLNNNSLIGQTISQEYDLIMVDEFQDVSPLQLALFVKLSEIVERNVWVGDPKQCIYAFRGADPELMMKVLEKIPKEQKETLPYSYRSRAPLVALANSVFSEALEEILTLEQAPKKHTGRDEGEENIMGTAFQNWQINYQGRKSKEKNYTGLAEAIKDWVSSAPMVFDKTSQTYRPAIYSDIAILCRKNNNCRELGDMLNSMGVPSVTAGTGLRYEPEVIVLTALLKLAIFPNDTLAKSEVLLYVKYGGNQAALVDARMEVENSFDWEKEFEWLGDLKAISAIAVDLNVVHLLELIVARFDIGTLLAAWGNATARMANVNALLREANTYLEETQQLQVAASVPGFLTYLDRKNEYEKDELGVQKGNAVEVLTYHKSKGLEWPVVILYDLNEELPEAFYGVKMLPIENLNIENPLEDRKMVLNFKPFVNNAKHEHFTEVLKMNPLWEEFEEQQAQEERRLMYVGMTRARDYLIMATVAGSKEFLVPKLIHRGLDQSGATEGVHHLNFHQNYADITFEKKIIGLPDGNLALTDHTNRDYFTAPEAIDSVHPLGQVTPSALPPLEEELKVNSVDIHTRIKIDKSSISDTLLGTVIHQIICSYNPVATDSVQTITQQLEMYELQEVVTAEWMLKSIQALYEYVDGGIIHKELPLTGIMPDGKKVSGYIDMVVEQEDGLILVDHKTFSAEEGDLTAKARSHSGQLALYQDILQKTLGKPVIKTCIYFVFEGKIIEIL